MWGTGKYRENTEPRFAEIPKNTEKIPKRFMSFGILKKYRTFFFGFGIHPWLLCVCGFYWCTASALGSHVFCGFWCTAFALGFPLHSWSRGRLQAVEYALLFEFVHHSVQLFGTVIMWVVVILYDIDAAITQRVGIRTWPLSSKKGVKGTDMPRTNMFGVPFGTHSNCCIESWVCDRPHLLVC